MTEFRWLITTVQAPGTFSEPAQLADGREAWVRLQVRPAGMVSGAGDWADIPVVSEVPELPRIQLVPGGLN